jgi:CBS domain containing-hemolysin-like protein
MTVGGISNDGTFAYPKSKVKIDLEEISVEVIDMDGVKIDKIMVKALK